MGYFKGGLFPMTTADPHFVFMSEGSISKTVIKKCSSVGCMVNSAFHHLASPSNLLCRYCTGSGCEDLPCVCSCASDVHICDSFQWPCDLGSFGQDFGQQRERGGYKKLQVWRYAWEVIWDSMHKGNAWITLLLLFILWLFPPPRPDYSIHPSFIVKS